MAHTNSHRFHSLLVAFILVVTLSTANGQDVVEVAGMNALSWNYAIFVIFVTVIKIVALVIGYMVVKLGYTTMMSGIKGDDSVEFGALGTTFKFKGVTPGLVLGVVGVLMMGWALSSKHQFSEGIQKTVAEQGQRTVQAGGTADSAKKQAVRAPDFSPERPTTTAGQTTVTIEPGQPKTAPAKLRQDVPSPERPKD